jgi:hypothetical protein
MGLALVPHASSLYHLSPAEQCYNHVPDIDCTVGVQDVVVSGRDVLVVMERTRIFYLLLSS